MKRWFCLALLVFVGTAGWRIGETLSSDALSMAVGVLFGVMAGVPAALLVMAGSRQRTPATPMQTAPVYERQMPAQVANGWGVPPYAQQPPIILLTAPHSFDRAALQPPPANAGWLPQEPPVRHFTVVGDREEILEDW